MDLFDHNAQSKIKASSPLPDRLRPTKLGDYVGQSDILSPGSFLRASIENDNLHSMILWGPPGSGKTTLASIIASETQSYFVELSAISSGKKDLLEAVEVAQGKFKYNGQHTILFIDEIHRWNKAQQDALLPYVEKGTVTLIGATTENPSFEVISPLLSRLRVYVLKPLPVDGLRAILKRALSDKARGLGTYNIKIKPEIEDYLLNMSMGDARVLLNALEVISEASSDPSKLTIKEIKQILQHDSIRYDKKGDEHYNIISAFIKSIRGSNVDGALYWLARMIEAGEDPKFIARRMVILASEDIGNADTNALVVANSVFSAVEKIGFPECQLNLAQGVVYLCEAPKSNKSYSAIMKALKCVRDTGNLAVPMHLRNAPTGLMKDLGYGEGYKYAHDEDDSSQKYLPPEINDTIFYES